MKHSSSHEAGALRRFFLPTATRAVFRRVVRATLLTAVAGFLAARAEAQTVYLLSGSNLLSTTVAAPTVISSTLPITGVTAGETLVGIDVRPQNQLLYALGVDPAADRATLYVLNPQTGFAAQVGSTSGQIAFTTDGATVVDLPDPVIVGWDIDFNTALDRLRIVAGSLNFRVNPNTGAPVDGGAANGVNPDGAINSGTTTVSGTAYTNNEPNNGGITTQYTVDSVTNSIFIQNPPNLGTQIQGPVVTLNGNTLDFANPTGFDIAPGVNAPSSNTAVTSGSAILVASVSGVTGLYLVDLVTGAATLQGNVGTGAFSVRSAAVQPGLTAAIGLSADGSALVRYNPLTPGTVTVQGINTLALAAGETLVAIDGRPQTGQIYGLAVDAAANMATLYLVDPQSGALTAIGAQGGISFVQADGVTPVDLPDPATVGYGIDFNPTVDRLRVVTSSGLNFRVNPNTGAAVDGNFNLSASPPNGVNPDVTLNGLPVGSTGASSTAYTNSFAQPLTGGVTTQYSLDAASNKLFIQNPPNAGTLTSGVSLTLGGSELDVTDVSGFDIAADVAVGSSAAPAGGAGWLVATVGGVTSQYRVNLATGETTLLGSVGSGSSSLSGLIVWAGPQPLAGDAVTTTNGETRLNPLANDGFTSAATITQVSDPAIVIQGRTLIIPAGYTGTFSYAATDGTITGRGFVTVNATTPIAVPTTFNGVLLNSADTIVGWANVTISAKGIATVLVRAGTDSVSTKVTLPAPPANGTGSTFTKLGNLTVTRNANNTVSINLEALGGVLDGTLRAAQTTSTAKVYHVALASNDPAIPGGGYAVVTVSTKGAVKLVGVLPDGGTFMGASSVSDNGTIAFFALQAKSKPAGTLGGELLAANLPTTDITGEIRWVKLPQVPGVKGLHLAGVSTILMANGSLVTGPVTLAGPGTLTVSGGNLAVDETTAVTVIAGVPAPLTGAMKSWKATLKSGLFTGTVAVPGIAKPVKASGLYLPKSSSAWGFFPGTTEGGRIELTVP